MFMSACVLARLRNLLYVLLFVGLSFPSTVGLADSQHRGEANLFLNLHLLRTGNVMADRQ